MKASKDWFTNHAYSEDNRSFIWTPERISRSGAGAESAVKLLAKKLHLCDIFLVVTPKMHWSLKFLKTFVPPLSRTLLVA